MSLPPGEERRPPARRGRAGDPLVWAAPLLIAAALGVLLLMFWLGAQTDRGGDEGIPQDTDAQPVSAPAGSR